jgi:peptidoglycan/xylan/chitin deacetylase (PgdA/CDA1 family)
MLALSAPAATGAATAGAADAEQLACNLSPLSNPEHYRRWWEQVPRRATYARWLWKEILPRATGACAEDARATFWTHAVPDEWVAVRARAGWPAPRGGYYAQTLWLRAVPRGWARRAPEAGWPARAGGYYAQTLWLQAVPDAWVKRAELTVGRGGYRQPHQGYYRHTLLERAVPDGWAPEADIGGWHARSGGYYAQWFWLAAVPASWAPREELALDGRARRGFYEHWLYHLGVPRDLAWRDELSLGGTRGSGYYTYWFRRHFARTHPHYRRLERLAGGYLKAAAKQGPAPVDRWFAPDARAVVVLTFDAEGNWAENCAIARALRAAGVTATFYVLGGTALEVERDPVWRACLGGFDIANHTQTHGNHVGFAGHPDAEQLAELGEADAHLRRVFAPHAPDSFRTPFCDNYKTFDGGVLRNLLAVPGRFRADSSIPTVSPVLAKAGLLPPLALRLYALADFPYPFVVPGPAGGRLIEVPFVYPSDSAARGHLRLETAGVTASRPDQRHALDVWKAIFDDVYAKRGVMVTLMHPQFQSRNGTPPDALIALVAHMQAREGVHFSTVHDVTARFERHLAERPRPRRARPTTP